jgi:hypothetical protein
MPLTQVQNGMLAGVIPASLGGTGTTAGVTGFKNRIINGDMTISQRGTSFTNPNGVYTLDRWFASCDVSGTVVAQTSTAPANFNNSLRWTNGTGATTPVGNTNYITQFIEGYNVQDLAFGTANAKTITVSFWVRSSITGQYSVAITNNVGGSVTRSYIAPYTINSANTWEFETITIPGDTTGTWGITNGIGMGVQFDLGSGSNWNGTANAWQSGAFFSLSSNVNFHGTTNATWNVTGVQLEVGSTATNFDVLDYGTELFLCQRYYEQMYAQTQFFVPNNSYLSYGLNLWQFRVPKRATPTVSPISGASISMDRFGIGPPTVTGSGIDSPSLYSARANVIYNTNYTCGEGITLQSTYWQASAEL